MKIKSIIILPSIFFIISCTIHPERGVLDTSFLDEKGKVYLNVPFFEQKRFYCGPASLAGVMNYWNIKVTPDEIAEEISTEKHAGSLSLDLFLYAKKKGLNTVLIEGGFKELIDYLKRGYPVIVMVDLGFGPIQKNHFMVVVGYNEKGVFANSKDEKGRFYSYEEMGKIWGKTNYWGLVVSP